MMRSFTASLRPLARVLDRLAEGVAAVALLVAAVPVYLTAGRRIAPARPLTLPPADGSHDLP